MCFVKQPHLIRDAVYQGTPPFMSPEMVLEKRYNHKTDVWSLGATMYSLLYRRYPYEIRKRDKVVPPGKKRISDSQLMRKAGLLLVGWVGSGTGLVFQNSRYSMWTLRAKPLIIRGRPGSVGRRAAIPPGNGGGLEGRSPPVRS